MNQSVSWSTADFDRMSWHDVHVHSFSLEVFDAVHGGADLVFDIDYILEWLRDGPDMRFSVCRAELRFTQVSRLKVALDYASPSAGMCPFSLSEIRRELLAYHNGKSSYLWHLEVSWPVGLIEFESQGYVQHLVGEPREQRAQWLAAEHRAKRNMI
jgi:hypothetical protein